MSLFKKASSETELEAGMQAAQDQMASEEANADDKTFSAALAHLEEAAQHFIDASCDDEAIATMSAVNQVLAKRLETRGQRKPQQDWTPPWKQTLPKPAPMRAKEVPEPSAPAPAAPFAEEPKVEKLERPAPKREEVMGNALDLLAKMREKNSYVPTILYLRSVLRDKPSPKIFDKFNVVGPDTSAAFLAGIEKPLLRSILKSHFEEFNVSIKEVDRIAQRLDPELSEGEAKEKAKEKVDEDFQGKMKDLRRQQRRMQESDFAPSPVRRIDPMTGDVTEIPVEFRDDVRRPRFMMKEEPKPELTDEEKEALREERKREQLKKNQLPMVSRPNMQQTRQELEQARLEDEARRQYEDRVRQQQSLEQTRQREEDEAWRNQDNWLNEARVRIDVLEKSAMTSYRSAIDIMQGSPVKSGKKSNTVKNPGKSKDEKKVWQMYGYNANDSSDAQSADDEDDESFED